MDFISLEFNIFEFLKNNFPGYAASIAASVTYDSAKSTDFDILRSRLIETVFSEFCPDIGCEFNASVTVNLFYDALSDANGSAIQDDYILKEVICKTLDTELTTDQYAHWIKIFCWVCTNPDYQWIMNYIDHDKKVFQSKNITQYVLDQMKTSFENVELPNTPVDALHEDLRLLQLLSLVPHTSTQIRMLALYSFEIENKIFWSRGRLKNKYCTRHE